MKEVMMVMMLGLVFMTGCVSTESYTYNLQQSTARSAGDVAMTVLLDEGIKKDEAVALCNALVKFLEDGKITKSILRDGVNKLLTTTFKSPQYSSYVDGVFLLIPSDIDANEKIPENIRQLIISFVKDGAVHAANLYDPAHLPKKEDSE